MVELKDNERIDYMYSDDLRIIQDKTAFSFSMDTFLVMGTALLILGLIGPTFLLPFVFKFGAEKGRIAFYVMIGFVCAVITLLTGLGFQAILPFSKPVLIGICGIGILLYILSWQLSILFFKKREL